MESEKMTLHKALSELKLIDKKVERRIQDLQPIGGYKKDDLVNGTTKQEDFEKNAKAGFDSITDLIERKSKIKSALVIANTQVEVTVGGKKMSIADALNYKDTLALRKRLVSDLKGKYNHIVSQVNTGNEKVEANIVNILQGVFGNNTTEKSSDAALTLATGYRVSNKLHLSDPLNLQAKIEEMEKEIETFESDIDAVLSETNALNFIEI